MPIPTLRVKNQLTLPSDLASKLGFHVGDAIQFEAVDGGIVIRKFDPRAFYGDDWLTRDVLAEIDEAAKGPFSSFDSMEEMERHLNV